MTLSGESNTIRYSVEPQFFDCGLQPYDKPAERDLYVINTGKVCTTPAAVSHSIDGVMFVCQVRMG
jgi:hypothetical protein